MPNKQKQNGQSGDELVNDLEQVASTEAEPIKDETRKFEKIVGDKARRKLKARTEGKQSAWFGLGMFGLVGWSVVVPMLLGVFAGAWIDGRWPSQVSWKLTLMFAGLVIGCINAWHWIQKETQDE